MFYKLKYIKEIAETNFILKYIEKWIETHEWAYSPVKVYNNFKIWARKRDLYPLSVLFRASEKQVDGNQSVDENRI